MKIQTEAMDAPRQFCPNRGCKARGQIGRWNIVIHSRKGARYRCETCGKTFSAQKGTMFEGLLKPVELIVVVTTLLAYGCPVQAILHAFGLDERTVASWRDRSGQHCEQIHHALVEQGGLDLGQVHADEIRVKGRQMIVCMGLALMVSTRLWLAGTVSLTLDTALADRLMQQVRRCAQSVRALLFCTDGWAAYPNSIRRAFREKVKETAGRGRACLRVWQQLHIGNVIKHTKNRHVVQAGGIFLVFGDPVIISGRSATLSSKLMMRGGKGCHHHHCFPYQRDLKSPQSARRLKRDLCG